MGNRGVQEGIFGKYPPVTEKSYTPWKNLRNILRLMYFPYCNPGSGRICPRTKKNPLPVKNLIVHTWI